MGSDLSIAEAVELGDSGVMDELRKAPLLPRPDNLVPRPWGGDLLSHFKDLPVNSDGPVGECFEISAWPNDPEANQFPSIVRFSDGSEMPLPNLLRRAGVRILGDGFGEHFPLLPKLLDIKELLSIQGHPEGNTEVYVIVQADPGATLRLGFRRDMDPGELGQRLKAGRAAQQRVLQAVAAELTPDGVQTLIAPWLSQRDQSDVPGALQQQSIAAELTELHATYWWVLDAMNVIPAVPGQVILNANPTRVLDPGRKPSAEVHALGNPERAEFLALEIRKPGPTFRAWDNVRFPVREVDVDAAIDALSLRATTPTDFLVDRKPIGDQPGMTRSVDCDDFCIDHVEFNDAGTVSVPNAAVHCLHVIGGEVTWIGGDQQCRLDSGQSAIVPAFAGGYQLRATAASQVVKVTPKLPSS